MKVKELIKELKKYPGNADVILSVPYVDREGYEVVNPSETFGFKLDVHMDEKTLWIEGN